jgi:hypothetical protein
MNEQINSQQSEKDNSDKSSEKANKRAKNTRSTKKKQEQSIARTHCSRRVRFNVGGYHYETTVETLLKYPDTLLGKMFQPENAQLLPSDNEIFIDRNGEIFPVVLNFYRNGTIIIPPNLSPEQVEQELDFFQIKWPPPSKLQNNSPASSSSASNSDEEKNIYSELKKIADSFHNEIQKKEQLFINENLVLLYTLVDNFIALIKPTLFDLASRGFYIARYRLSTEESSRFETWDPKERIIPVKNSAIQAHFENLKREFDDINKWIKIKTELLNKLPPYIKSKYGLLAECVFDKNYPSTLYFFLRCT